METGKRMGKELAEMTLAELWDLFPVFLVEPDAKWADAYRRMEASLRKLLADFPVARISHVGSTAIQGIRAKDIVDILVEFAGAADMREAARVLEGNGFLVMSAGENRISLNRGYTKDGFAEEVFHVHLRRAGDDDEVHFRDYLNAHPRIAKEYESLKLALKERHERDRDAYTAGKTEFVRKWTAAARKEHGAKH